MHYIDAVIDAMEMTTGNRTANADTLMSDKRHRLNAQYERSLEQVQVAERAVGKPFDAQTQNLSGALALESEKAGVVGDRVAFADSGRAFAMQGATPEDPALRPGRSTGRHADPAGRKQPPGPESAGNPGAAGFQPAAGAGIGSIAAPRPGERRARTLRFNALICMGNRA